MIKVYQTCDHVWIVCSALKVFSSQSCVPRDLMYPAESGRRISRSRLSNLTFGSRESCTPYRHATNAHAHARERLVVARLCSSARRAYFVGSGPGHYFEIHEVEWRNRVEANFGAEGREGSYRSGPLEATFVGRRGGREKRHPATPRRVQAQSLFCMSRRRVQRLDI